MDIFAFFGKCGFIPLEKLNLPTDEYDYLKNQGFVVGKRVGNSNNIVEAAKDVSG